MRAMLRTLLQRFGPGPEPTSSTRVDFVICGTQKGGTTALDAYLREHPQVCMAERKEVHFFDDDAHFDGDEPDYAPYHACFEPGRSHRLLGEATPIYMYWRQAPRRLHAYNPDLKLIVLLRNPIERAYSHWNMQRTKDLEDLSFEDAIHAEQSRARAAWPSQNRLHSYVERGFYLEQLRRLWAHFPREHVLVLKSEDLKRDPQATLDAVCDFLGVRRLEHVPRKDVHSRPYASGLSASMRAHLREVFAADVHALERELGWDCSDWLA